MLKIFKKKRALVQSKNRSTKRKRDTLPISNYFDYLIRSASERVMELYDDGFVACYENGAS